MPASELNGLLEFRLPVVIVRETNPVSGTSPEDPILVAFFENPELLFGREMFSGRDSPSLVPPVSIALMAEAVFGADGLNAVLLTLLDYRQPLFFAKASARSTP